MMGEVIVILGLALYIPMSMVYLFMYLSLS